MGMISELRAQLDIYDQDRRALLDALEGLTADQLRTRPGPDKWSILEIVQHMVLSEREVLEHLPEPEALIDRKRGLRARLAYVVVVAIIKWNIPVPVPSDGMVPDGNTSLSELRRQWDEHIPWLRGYLAIVGPKDLKRAVFRHPVAGPLTPALTSRLARLHFDAHLRQIRRINPDTDLPPVTLEKTS